MAQRVLRGGPIRLVGYASSVLLSLATISLTLRHLGLSESGRLFAGIAALALASALSDMGLAGIGLREYSTRPVAVRYRYLRDLATVRCAVFVLAAGPAIVLATAAVDGDDTFVSGLLLGVIAFLGTVVVTTSAIPFAERLDTMTQSMMQITQSAAALATASLLVAAGASTPWFFGVQLPGVGLALLLLKVRRKSDPLPWPQPLRVKHSWHLIDRQVLLFGAAVIIGVAFYRVGSLAVAFLSSADQAGLYGTAFRVADVLEAAAPLLMMIVLPVLAVGAQSPALLRRRVRSTVEIMAPLGALVGAGTFGASFLAIGVVGGSTFEGAVIPLQVLSGMLVLAYPCQVYGYALLAARRHREMLTAVLAAFLISVGALGAMVPALGATGAAAALVAGQATLLVAYMRSYVKTHGGVGHARPLSISLGAYLLAIGVASQLDARWWSLTGAVGITALVVGAPTARALHRALRPTAEQGTTR